MMLSKKEIDTSIYIYDVCGYYVETMCMEIERDVHMKWVYPWIHTSLFLWLMEKGARGEISSAVQSG